MKEIWTAQYNMIQGSRAVLFNYCDTITLNHFIAENSDFGRGGSIRNLLVHNGHVYRFWIGHHAFGREMEYPEYGSIITVDDCRAYYTSINELVEEFIHQFADRPHTLFNSNYKKPASATALEVFTHVTTHEFHHKGQMLSISRHLGYTPVDTDVIR